MNTTESIRSASETQAAMVQRMRAESCIDPDVPVRGVPAPRPEFGPSALEWFRAKEARRERGKYWPLHTLALAHR